MTTEIIVAGISLLFILFLIFMRYFRVAYANGNGEFLLKTDSWLRRLWFVLSRFYSNTIQDLTDLIKDLPHIFLHFLNRIFYRLYKKTKKLVDLIKGNRIRTDGGSVSIYLKNIENKD